MPRPDWVSLLEASYDLAASEAAWMKGVLAHAAPLFERRIALALLLVRVTPTRFELESVEAIGHPDARGWALATNVSAPAEVVDIVYRGGASLGSLSEQVFARYPEGALALATLTGGRVRDVLGVAGHTGTGLVAMFSAPLAERSTPTAAERRRWPLAAAHVAAGLRLRRRAARLDTDTPGVEAILDPGGRLLDATGRAAPRAMRDALRAAVRRIERSRSAGRRRDADGALADWHGLVSGRWSLVDRFDTDGRRFVVAVQNDPEHPDPRGLGAREREVAEFVGLGRSTKEIAYTLGLSLSSVSENVSRAARKLGLRSRAELAAFFAPGGVRARLAEVAVAGERLLIGACPLLDPAALEPLTETEREITALLVSGSTNADIAARRATSERTVANQVSAIFRKLGVGSRTELAARLSSPSGSK